MANTHPQVRRRMAREAILKAAGLSLAKDKGKALNRIAAHFEISRQAAEQWWVNGLIPKGRVEALALKAGIKPWQVDPVEFPQLDPLLPPSPHAKALA